MKSILKMKWAVAAIWIIAAVVLMISAPSMEELVRTKGQITVPQGYSSSIAGQLLKEIGSDGEDGKGGGHASVLVFYQESGLGEDALAEIKATVDSLKADSEKLGIRSMMTHYDIDELKEQMVAKDGKAILVLLQTEPLEGQTMAEQRDMLYEALADVKTDHYLTGDWLIAEDVIQSSQDGLKKTELITVGFILIILFAVFRSAAAPFVPLLTVGFSYLVSQSIVAYLAEYLDFPLSNFTQIFMVAVLFGIGTDYCILLISRYKEELSRNDNKVEAIITTYKTAGKTVFFSGLAVLVGFTSIGFSTFMLYRSAVAVAVGIAILLIALYTLVPFFLVVLGKAMFWPAKGSIEHKESRLWGAVGSFSLKRPIWAIVILAVLIVPSLVAYKGSISYNSLDEIGDKYNSVKGFNLIADSFGPGETLPSTVVVKTDMKLDNPEHLALVEKISRELASVDGVKAVRSATRPAGEIIEQFLVADQVTLLDDGLTESTKGLDQIESGLAEAGKALESNAPKLKEAVDGANQLAAGTDELKQGVEQLSAGLKQLESGLKDGSAGAKELSKGIAEAKESAGKLAAALEQLRLGYNEMGGGLAQLAQGYDAVAESQKQLADGLTGAVAQLGALQEKYPELSNDVQFLTVTETIKQLEQGSHTLGAQLKEMNKQLTGVSGGMKQADDGFKEAIAGQNMLAAGLEQLVAGLDELEQGITAAASGQGKVLQQLPSMSEGLNQLSGGQQELAQGFATMNDQLSELSSGLTQSADGISQVSEGLAAAGGYLQGLADAPNKQMSGWFIPQDAIDDESFQASLDVYMSADRQLSKFDVIFDSSPYAEETMNEIEALEAAVQRAVANTKLADAEIAIGGITSMNHDLSTISGEDYSRTVIFMLVGISIILIVLFRSIVITAYIMFSLIVTFYTSQALAELIFVRIAGLSGISWAVPFFGFVILIALGVDYSIFLMDRFKEFRHMEPKEGILAAMRNMGSVIMSAAVILGGTFAAMLPSGVMSLLQIATIVLCGLFLYALVMLPLFIPVMVRMFGEANWWPFMKKD